VQRGESTIQDKALEDTTAGTKIKFACYKLYKIVWVATKSN